MNLQQADLFEPIRAVYEAGGTLSNADLYERLATDEVIPKGALLERIPVGKAGDLHNPTLRAVRWTQQTLRRLGLLEKVPGKRGVWRSTQESRGDLTPAPPRRILLGFSTKLGLALWGDCKDVFSQITEPVHCVITSPPYPIAKGRAYGAVTEDQYVDFICHALEPLVRRLATGACIALNLTNDVFLKGTPLRSMFKERLVLAMHSRLGLGKLDEICWLDSTKAPGPIAWASKERFLLHTGYEPVLIFTNSDRPLFASNQRVLLPHSAQHLKLIAKGGEARTASYGDGANRIKPGAFSRPTAGKIPTNVLSFPHRCRSQDDIRKFVKSEGLPTHGATFPLALAKFLVEYLSEAGQLVADPFSGWFTTALAAEMTGRRWVGCERMLQYIEGARRRFTGRDGFLEDYRLAA